LLVERSRLLRGLAPHWIPPPFSWFPSKTLRPFAACRHKAVVPRSF
jgi:hypothetical protein